MPLRLNDANESVRAWRSTMNLRFGGLYSRLRGPLPKDTNVFGKRAEAWQMEYELRTSQTVDGIVSDDDLRALNVRLPDDGKPWLFTVHGTGQPDPTGPGIPADIAREVLDIYRWQPIGNYPASTFPMWPSIMQGYEELVLQILAKLEGNNDKFSMIGYSQGAVVVGQVLKHEILSPSGRLHKFLHRLKKVIFFGNPMRQKGIHHFDEWIYEDATDTSHGILTEDLLEGLEKYDFQVRDYAHKLDMYASNEDSDKDEYKRAIAKIVMKATDFYKGPDSVVSQLKELGQRPLQEGIAMAGACIDAMRFFTNLGPHVYNWDPAVRFLREP